MLADMEVSIAGILDAFDWDNSFSGFNLVVVGHLHNTHAILCTLGSIVSRAFIFLLLLLKDMISFIQYFTIF